VADFLKQPFVVRAAKSGSACYGVRFARFMKAHTDTLTVSTRGKGTYEITDEVARIVRSSGIGTGIATVFLQHTSASLVIYENADPTARTDLHEFFERLVPEDEDYYTHTAEGGDDSTSHLKMVLTRSSENIPVVQGRLALGTWQGIFVFEHRNAPHRRNVVVSVVGT
jgi:secondary thiamine-phosphate synthase enzyme